MAAAVAQLANAIWADLTDTSKPDALVPRFLKLLAFPSTFSWDHGITPFTHSSWPVATVFVYLFVIFRLQAWMDTRKERFEMKYIVKVHNLILCVWSFFMFVGTAYFLLYTYMTGTLEDITCDANKVLFKGWFGFIAWNYYVSKYYELLDTVILVLRKRKLSLLHLYHHCIILVATWSWNDAEWTQHWLAILLNTFVHTVMYYYYFYSMHTGKRPWWRKWITTMQLIQFVTVFFFVFVWLNIALVNPTLNTSWPFLNWERNRCSGNVKTGPLVGLVINVSFIALFGNFYVQNYLSKKKAAAARRRQAAVEAQAETQKAVEDSGVESDGDKTLRKRSSTPTPRLRKNAGK